MRTKLTSLILFTIIATLLMIAESCKSKYNSIEYLQANNFTNTVGSLIDTQRSTINNKNYFGGMNFYFTSSLLQGVHRQGCAATRSTFRAEVEAIN